MTNYFNQMRENDIRQVKRGILSRADGRCMCHSYHHDHKEKCNRLLQSTFKYIPTIQDGSPLNSATWIAVCSVCARYAKDVGY